MVSPVHPLVARKTETESRTDENGGSVLSFAQERLWFLEQLESGRPVYNVPLAWRVQGQLNKAALQSALSALAARHEPLRTVVESRDGQPLQRVLPAGPVPLPEMDLRRYPAAEREHAARAQADKEARRPFRLDRDLPLRSLLLRLADQDWIFVLTVHHIAWDGWSVPILYRELEEGYAAALRERSPEWAPLPMRYLGHARKEREEWTGERLRTELDWWRQQLAGAPETTLLSADDVRPQQSSGRGAWQAIMLPRQLLDALQDLSRREGCSLFMTLLAAWFVLLSRLNGQQDLVVGSPMANRSGQELDGLIGLFINSVALRGDLSGDPPFRELLNRVRNMTLDVYDHQQLPFDKLVEALRPDRNPGISPLFQTMFVLQNPRPQAPRLEELELQRLDLETGTAKFDLTLMAEDKNGLEIGAEYNCDLFSAAQIHRLLSRYERILQGVVARPQARLHELPLIDEAERLLLLADGSGVRAEYPRCGVNDLFEKQAARRRGAVALEWKGGQLSYQELDQQANQLAWGLRRQGAGPNTVVGICLDRSPNLIVAMLGVLKTGAAYLPFSPSEPAGRRNPLLMNSAVTLVIANPIHCQDLPPSIVIRSPEQLRKGQPETRLWESGVPDQLACVLSTSGSTGAPKGVEVLHRGIVRLLIGADYVHLDANEVLLHLSPVSFDLATFEVWGALLHGARCVLYPPQPPTPRELAEVVQRHHVTTLWLTSSLFNEVVDEAPQALAGVRQLLAGGEALSVEHVRRVMELYPKLHMINGYGPTESTTFTTCYRVPDPPKPGARSVPIGRPIANTDVYVLDAFGQLQPRGVPGELYIGGDGLARGYRNQPQRTAERFVPNPLCEGERLYRSGDRVCWREDGTLEFLGRTDDQVKLRGYRIELGEVEAVLTSHPNIERAAVAVRGEASARRLVAWLVASPGLDLGTLRIDLRGRLPEFMIPAQFLRVERLPLTPQGKLDRRALPEPSACETAPVTPMRPYSPEEARLERIWKTLLGVAGVGPLDNFFELGGHSLLAGKLLARIEQSFGVRLTMASLFEHPTLEAMAAALNKLQPQRWLPPIVPIESQGSQPPFFCVGAGPFFRPLARCLGPDQPFLGINLGNDHQLLPPYRFEDLGALVARAIRERQPEGPIHLGGWCLHGVVAYEAACQLRRQGREVPTLALFDVPHPSFWRGVTMEPERVNYHLQQTRKLGAREVLTYLRERIDGLGVRLQTHLWTAAYRLHRMARVTPRWWFRDMLQLLYFTARHYYPEDCGETVYLFRSQQRPGGAEADPAFGWRPLLGDRLVVREIPGDHRSMFQNPSVSALAAELKRCWTLMPAGELPEILPADRP